MLDQTIEGFRKVASLVPSFLIGELDGLRERLIDGDFPSPEAGKTKQSSIDLTPEEERA